MVVLNQTRMAKIFFVCVLFFVSEFVFGQKIDSECVERLNLLIEDYNTRFHEQENFKCNIRTVSSGYDENEEFVTYLKRNFHKSVVKSPFFTILYDEESMLVIMHDERVMYYQEASNEKETEAVTEPPTGIEIFEHAEYIKDIHCLNRGVLSVVIDPEASTSLDGLTNVVYRYDENKMTLESVTEYYSIQGEEYTKSQFFENYEELKVSTFQGSVKAIAKNPARYNEMYKEYKLIDLRNPNINNYE